ncbi:MAG: hypothetical protein H7Z11_00325 [Verrucomicrobia bacterium]|nr:hypothetical protein [Leptolyngbya sp. ES-bin-22]
MISPTDQPQAAAARRSTDAPTLWLSLALGSVLIHLVLFIIISVLASRTAKVELEMEPIGVEFVDPNAIAARPSQTVPNASANRQAPLTTQIPQASLEPKRSVEQSIAPLPPVKRRPLPRRSQQPQPFRNPLPSQPDPAPNAAQPQPDPFRNSLPQQPDRPDLTQPQPAPSNPSQTGLPSALPNPSGNPDPQPTGSQAPVESGTKIALPPQGESVSVVVSNPRQKFDLQKQTARPIKSKRAVSLSPPSAIAPNQNINIQTSLEIDQNGFVLRALETKLLSPESLINKIDQSDLDSIANQIFRDWDFEPALDSSDGVTLKPQASTLIIDAQIQFP